MPNLQRGSQLRLENLSYGHFFADENVEIEYAVFSWLEVFTLLLFDLQEILQTNIYECLKSMLFITSDQSTILLSVTLLELQSSSPRVSPASLLH